MRLIVSYADWLLRQLGYQGLKDCDPCKHFLMLCHFYFKACLIGSLTMERQYWLNDP